MDGENEGARLFVLVPSDRRSGSGQTSERRERPLNMRQDWFVIVRVVKYWHRLPRGCEVSILADSQNLPGHYPE